MDTILDIPGDDFEGAFVRDEVRGEHKRQGAKILQEKRNSNGGNQGRNAGGISQWLVGNSLDDNSQEGASDHAEEKHRQGTQYQRQYGRESWD